MKYNINQLAQMYNEDLSKLEIDIQVPVSQPFDLSSYNEYKYNKLMKQFEKLYDSCDSLELTEKFLKGD